MTRIYSKALDETIDVGRIIGEVKGDRTGPCIIFMAGIHGNEPAGVFALQQVSRELKLKKHLVQGSFYAISGNLWALEHNERYHQMDLNRLWTAEKVEELRAGNPGPDNEDMQQQKEILEVIENILSTEPGPFYFMDLHTTSSPTPPFLTVNDSLLNRKFTLQYPLPIILGIEEFLDGPILSHINELGYVAFGFECGRHDDLQSIENGVAFTWLSMVFAGIVDPMQITFRKYFELLEERGRYPHVFFELYGHYQIREGENFQMKKGYRSFQEVDKGEVIATSDGRELRSPHSSMIFMPLYQSQGDDGFFNIRPIPRIFIRLSSVLRSTGADRLLALLPGVSWASGEKHALKVDLRIARFFAREIFHLLGYRNKTIDKSHLLVKNRDRASRDEAYAGAAWMKGASFWRESVDKQQL